MTVAIPQPYRRPRATESVPRSAGWCFLGVWNDLLAAYVFTFGLALLPFVVITGAFLSQHPRAPGASARAMGLSLLVGIPVFALAGAAAGKSRSP